MRIRSRLQSSAVAMLIGFTAACGGGEPAEEPATETPPAETPAPAAAPAGAAVNTANLPAGVTAEMVQEGQQIFAGAGICFTCHGQNGVGTALAPNLTDATWINVQAGPNLYEDIVNVVNAGVPQPKEHPAPMPPKGGSQITEDQVRAVAAYVYSLSQG